MKYARRLYGSRVWTHGFCKLVDVVSIVDLGRERSIFSSEGCTELYIVSGRVRGDANASREREERGLAEFVFELL